MKSFLSPKVKLKKSSIGQGLFALKKIRKDEVVVDFLTGPGQYLPVGGKVEKQLFRAGYDYMIQVDDKQFFAATDQKELEAADYINHSCTPTCGIKDQLKIVAMRLIQPGEEITFDYAMTESSKYKMRCHCKAANCRGTVTGNDWRRPDLQKRYRGYFSNYLAKKISKLSHGPTSRV